MRSGKIEIVETFVTVVHGTVGAAGAGGSRRPPSSILNFPFFFMRAFKLKCVASHSPRLPALPTLPGLLNLPKFLNFLNLLVSLKSCLIANWNLPA